MKILIGVCGIGKGHSSRQLTLARHLQKRGHEIHIATFGKCIDIFQSEGFTVYDIWVPYITYKFNRMNYMGLIANNWKDFIPGMFKNKKFMKKAVNYKPNICIVDYEPNVARVAYKMKIPLLSIDQQSKFLYLSSKEIDGFSVEEEIKRLNLFFPKIDERIILSFYNFKAVDTPDNVHIFSPIYRQEIKPDLTKEKKVLIYFSQYINSPIQQKLQDILQICSQVSQYTFHFYTHEKESMESHSKNIEIYSINTNSFAEDLSSSAAVITTAGHTLISEAIYCGVPVYVLPLPTFDQHYCARIIDQNKLGMSLEYLTLESLTLFLQNLDIYRSNIASSGILLRDAYSLEKITERIERY